MQLYGAAAAALRGVSNPKSNCICHSSSTRMSSLWLVQATLRTSSELQAPEYGCTLHPCRCRCRSDLSDTIWRTLSHLPPPQEPPSQQNRLHRDARCELLLPGLARRLCASFAPCCRLTDSRDSGDVGPL